MDAALADMAARCAAWDADGTPVEGWIAALRDACLGEHCGYQIARNLETRHHVMPNADLVEILEHWFAVEVTALDVANADWVKRNGIAAQLPIDAQVTVGGHVGTITAIYPGTGVYVVNIPQRGHLSREDRQAGRPGTYGVPVPFEQVEGA